MNLPKINYQLFEVEIPSLKQKIKMRPMLMKEEKLLLIAKETQQAEDILGAIKQVVNNCIITENVNVDNLAIFDLEYLFIRLRATSINNIVKVTYVDNEDQQNYDFEVDLNTIEIRWPELKDFPADRIIKIDNKVSFKLRYPSAALYSDVGFLNAQGPEVVETLTINAIEKVYSETAAFSFQESTDEEKKEFVANLPLKIFDKVREFLGNLPTLYHVINYKNSKGSDRKIEMTTLNDFFTLG